MHAWNLSLLKLDLAEINRHQYGLIDFLACLVVGDYTSSGGYHHAIHGSILECIIRSGSAAQNIDRVEMSSDKAVLPEIRVLCACVRRVSVREGDLQYAPTLSVLRPRGNLSSIEAGVGVEERRCEITPERVTAEIPGVQFVPFGIGGLPDKG